MHVAPEPGPVDWPTVIARNTELYLNNLAIFDDLPAELAESRPPQYAGADLGGADNTLAAIAIMAGPERCMPLFAAVAPQIDHVLDEIGMTIDRSTCIPALYTLSYLNVARCCGAPVSERARDIEREWLPLLAERARDLTDRERHTLSLAACAAPDVTLVTAFVGGSLPATFVPGESFGFDVPSFARYLASAIDRGGEYLDVEPAWHDFVHRFPYKLDTRMLDWADLMWAGRVVLGTIGDLGEDWIAREIHETVRYG